MDDIPSAPEAFGPGSRALTERAHHLGPHHICVFDTALGACGIAWSEHGVTRFQLPEADRGATERRLRRAADATAETPPPAVGAVVTQVQRYMAGVQVDFSDVALDLAGVGEFHRKVYSALRAVGWGQTATYGDLARQVDAPGAARAVGQAMGRNPIPVIIPCHRVLASGRGIGGLSAFGGTVTKERLLALEGVHLGFGQLALPGLLPARR